jgi:5-methylcytosine-specific restriction endonuclease McrA
MSKAERKRFKIGEVKEEVFDRDEWTCQVCGMPVTTETAQLAHRIPQSKVNIKKFGEEIIHHPLNMLTVCCLRCNNVVQVNAPLLQEQIEREIYDEIKAQFIY